MEHKRFDPLKYKKTTEEQWNQAAEAWHRWGPLLDSWLGPATEYMLDQAAIGPGSHVLDVAAGAGEQSIKIARRIGRDGRLLATDLSSDILQYLQKSAEAEGLLQVETKRLDGEELDSLSPQLFDAVISRVGMIYFPDQQKALKGMKACLKPGGKLSVMVYGLAENNGFFSIPVSIIRKRANLPKPLEGQPGPFSLGDPAVLKSILMDAGFKQISVQSIDAPVELGSAEECIQFEKESFGALHQMLSGLSEDEQKATWNEIAQAMARFQVGDLFSGPCEVLVATGTH